MLRLIATLHSLGVGNLSALSCMMTEASAGCDCTRCFTKAQRPRPSIASLPRGLTPHAEAPRWRHRPCARRPIVIGEGALDNNGRLGIHEPSKRTRSILRNTRQMRYPCSCPWGYMEMMFSEFSDIWKERRQAFPPHWSFPAIGYALQPVSLILYEVVPYTDVYRKPLTKFRCSI